MRRGVRLSLIGLSSWLLACTSPLSPVNVLELAQAERRWAARPFRDYSFEYRVSCFCGSLSYEWKRVSVAHGQVVGVVYVANDSAMAQAEWAYVPTVDSLFARIRRLPHEDWVKSVRVEYDPRLGYPTLIETVSNVPDVGGAQYIRNLVATPVYEAFGVER